MWCQQSLDRPALTFDEVNLNLDKLKQPDTFLFDRLSRGTYANVVAKVAAGQSVKTEVQRRTIEVTGLFSLGASLPAAMRYTICETRGERKVQLGVSPDQTSKAPFQDRDEG
jgi:hypothetical protein